MRTVQEVSRLTGVSVRTLHHYDAIGLLPPTQLSPAGYRLYDATALERLRSILLYRELQFPLRDIKAILDSPGFDTAAALEQQIALLEAQRDRTQALIDHARKILHQGGDPMDFDVFDEAQKKQYRQEAKDRWGNTAAWQAFEQKEAAASPTQQQDAAAQLMALLAQFGTLRSCAPQDATVQEKVAALQAFITEHFYPCTDEILAGLGQMYAADERFRTNIDAAGGDGCAVFAAQAIAAYCAKK